MYLLKDNSIIDWRTKFWKRINKKIEYEFKKHKNLDLIDCFECNGSGKIPNIYNESVIKIKEKTIRDNLTDSQKLQIIKEVKQNIEDCESEENLSDVLKEFGLKEWRNND